MTLEKLNMLLVLAEERNVTHAAERLFITQPTMTVFLNKLETKLGFRLFDRTKNPVTLTQDGRDYIEKMQELLVLEEKLVEEIRGRRQAKQTIRIGIGYVNGQQHMPSLAETLLSAHPNLNIIIREGQELQLMEMLKDNEVDLLFGHLPIDPVHFSFEEVCEQELILAIPKNLMPEDVLSKSAQLLDEGCDSSHPLMIDPSVLTGLPLISPASMQGLFLNLKQFLDQYRIVPPRVIRTSNMITAANMVLKGLGYMYIAPILLKITKVADSREIIYCTLPNLIRSRKYYVGYDDKNPNLSLILEIRDLMRDILRNNEGA